MSVQVDPGERVALLGPNGVGKSTTLKVCSGLASADKGSVTVAGVDPQMDPIRARTQLGYVPDVGGLFPRLTGWEHLEVVARLHHLDDAWKARGEELLGRLGLADAAHERAAVYSHGMSRKLSVAMSTLHAPQVLLLDEPFDGVDPAGARAIRDLVSELSDDGAGVLCSTHLLDVAARFCHRLVVVAGGTVVAAGTAEEVCASAGVSELEDAYLVLTGQ